MAGFSHSSFASPSNSVHISQMPSDAKPVGGDGENIANANENTASDNYQDDILNNPELDERARSQAVTEGKSSNSGGGNKAVIIQNGKSNKSSIVQKGNGNYAKQVQKGNNNDLHLEQTGRNNSSVEKQTGDNNHKVIIQNGKKREKTSSGSLEEESSEE